MALCCCELETGVKILAIMSVVGSGMSMITFSFDFEKGTRDLKDAESFTWFLLEKLFDLILISAWHTISIFLLIGVAARDGEKCKVWLIVNPIIYAIEILPVFFGEITGPTPLPPVKIYVSLILLRLCGIAIHVYFLLVVHAFINEIKDGPAEGVAAVALAPQYGEPRPRDGQVTQNGGNQPMPQQPRRNVDRQ